MAADAESPVPIATPRGITLQVRNGVTRPLAARAGGQVLFADAQRHDALCLRQGPAQCEVRPAAALAPQRGRRPRAPRCDARRCTGRSSTRADGTRQWVYRGAPLYRFARDKAVGEADGDGADGGAWHVAAFQPGTGMALPDAVAGCAKSPTPAGRGWWTRFGMTLYAYRGDPGRHPNPHACAVSIAVDSGFPSKRPQIANAGGRFFGHRARRPALRSGLTAAGRSTGSTATNDRAMPTALASIARFQVALIVRYFMPDGRDDSTLRRARRHSRRTASGATLYERDLGATDESLTFRENHGWPALGRSFGTATCDEDCAKSWPPFVAPVDALPCGYWDIAHPSRRNPAMDVQGLRALHPRSRKAWRRSAATSSMSLEP